MRVLRPRCGLPLLLAALLLGCGEKGVLGPKAGTAPPTATPARDEAYQPPKDGRLTSKQVEQFLAVAAKVRTMEKGTTAASRSSVDQAPLDLAAAREVPVNVNEYLWVKERILEAEGALLAQKLNADHIALLEKTLSDIKRRRAEAPDEGSRKLLAEQSANFEEELIRTRRESREKEPETIRDNVRAILPFRTKLNALQGELSRMAPAPTATAIPRKR